MCSLPPALMTALLLLAPRVAHSDCIASEAVCSGTVSTPTTPTYSTSCDTPVMSIARIDYDVPGHRLRLSYDESMSVSLSLRDEFKVTGPPDGTPVPLHLRIRFHGTAGGYGSGPAAGGTMSARALAPLAGETTVAKTYGAPYGWNSTMTFSDSLDFQVTRPAGTPVGLEIHADSSYGYYLNNMVEFVFLDLPPGSQVTSCKDYLQEQPTPTLARSWGNLKAAYR